MKTVNGAIYFDGLCVLCSKEIDHYRKCDGAENFLFIDIAAATFNPADHGIDPRLAHKVMHVKGLDGELHQGVNAFRAIWKELPRYRFLYEWTNNKSMFSLFDMGYKIFVKIRPYLPRRKNDCSASPYCEVKRDK